MEKATVRAGSNIAFIKYWGVSDPAINLPLNNSISMTLADAYTMTTVAWDDGSGEVVGGEPLQHDQIMLDGKLLIGASTERLVAHLDRLRKRAGVDLYARVESRNNFPMASGIASSASGFSALTVAGTKALGLELDPAELSAIARCGSGSASRSILGGFVEWEQGTDHESSAAHQLYDETHWNLYDIVAVVSSAEKRVSSASGHVIAHSSPLLDGRISSLDTALEEVRAAIETRDLERLGPVIEQDAMAMVSVMMTSSPSLLYWQPGTIELIHIVRDWREENLPVYFTVDAGPNVHLMCEEPSVDAVCERLLSVASVQQVIVSQPGAGVEYRSEHLF